MIAFAVSAPLDREDALAADIVAHGHRVAARCASADDLVERLASIGADAVVVAGLERHCSPQLIAACDRAGVRLVAVVESDAEAGLVRRLGLRDAVPASEGFEAIECSLAVEVEPRPARARGEVTVVWGPAGAPGRTTTAISLAVELAASGASVVLCDVDTHSASIAPALGLLDEAPGFAAACRLTRTKSLTVDELERIAQVHATPFGSMRVLTGLSRISRWPELGADRVTAVLDACRDWVDHVVVDVASSLESDEEISSDLFAPRRNAATLAALAAADRVVAVGSGDPVGMTRLLHVYPDLVELVDASRVRLVMNRMRASAMGVAPESSVAQTLRRLGGIECDSFLPFDQSAADAAMLQGATLQQVAGRSRLRRALAALAQTMLPAPEPATRRSMRTARARPRLLRLPAAREQRVG